MRESATARANIQEEGPIQKAVLRITPPVQANGARENSAASEKAAVGERETRKPKPAPTRETAPRQRTVTVAENLQACHARRRVVGDERPSQDDARRAAEDGWMGAIRYDYGERYQDINKAKDVRLNCGPSSVSKALKTPYFRCAVEATPCRQMKGEPAEPDEHRYDSPAEESQISRR